MTVFSWLFYNSFIFTIGWFRLSAIDTKKAVPFRERLLKNIKPGGVLLSHGETPHYHRRRTFSLPSSKWDRVVPARYCRQANWFRNLGTVTLILRNHCTNQTPVGIKVTVPLIPGIN